MSNENSPFEPEEEFVRRTEINYIKERIALGKVLSRLGKMDEVKNELDALSEEKKRLTPPGYDEEEVRLYNLSTKKKNE